MSYVKDNQRRLCSVHCTSLSSLAVEAQMGPKSLTGFSIVHIKDMLSRHPWFRGVSLFALSGPVPLIFYQQHWLCTCRFFFLASGTQTSSFIHSSARCAPDISQKETNLFPCWKKKHSFAFFLFMSSQVLDVLHSSIYFKSNPVTGRCFGGFLVNLPGYFPYQWLAVLWQSSQGNIQAGSRRTNTNLISCLFTVEFLVGFST